MRNEVSAARAKAAVYRASAILEKVFTVGDAKKIRYGFLVIDLTILKQLFWFILCYHNV